MQLNPLNSKNSLKNLVKDFMIQENQIKKGGDIKGVERQKHLGRLTVRERLNLLLDRNFDFFEFGLWAGFEMYKEWGNLPAAGLITGIGKIENRSCMIIANDATVKAGAFFPQTIKKFLRAQRIAFEHRLPLIYLVDSSGVFLPLQEEIFPDEDDFGRIFRNNAIISAHGIPQIAAIMGNCIAGGSYLPVLCDLILMTEGSGLYLAGPALVKAAIGEITDTNSLGGANMHASKSGTIDYYEPNDPSCLKKLRNLISKFPQDPTNQNSLIKTKFPPEHVYSLISSDNSKIYNMLEVIDTLVDLDSFEEYKALYGKALITGFALIDNIPIGIIANQKLHTTTEEGKLEIGSVIYAESADKAARFVLDCNQLQVPILFLQDVVGFMVGKQSEQSGIIRNGAKLINAISNSVVPKITLLIGNSFGAGNYALCGKAYDPNFIFAWPNAKFAVMGAEQAAETLFAIQEQTAKRKGENFDQETAIKTKEEIRKKYLNQMDIRYGAARGWVDAIISPEKTRSVLIEALKTIKRIPLPYPPKTFHTGVIQT